MMHTSAQPAAARLFQAPQLLSLNQSALHSSWLAEQLWDSGDSERNSGNNRLGFGFQAGAEMALPFLFNRSTGFHQTCSRDRVLITA